MAKFDIIAATGCPTGIAHTFMAKEALEKAAAERGLTIKVETHGRRRRSRQGCPGGAFRR